MPLPYKKGSNGPEIRAWQEWAYKWAASYASLIGPKDSYFGSGEYNFVMEMQRRLGLPLTGIFDQSVADRVGFKPGGVAQPQPTVRRKIWLYSSPGSGADWNVGPSFELGEMCKNILKINHQPVAFQKGGYLGLLGGSAEFSYNEVIWDQCKSIEWLLDNNADAQEALKQAQDIFTQASGSDGHLPTDAELVAIASKLEFECHFSGYSQSADGTEEAIEYLFGDAGRVHPGDKTQTPSTGKYRLLRHCVKLVVQFGNPSTKNTGIARKTRSAWLDAKVRNVNKVDDFYAVVPATDKFRPAFYAIIVEAETELPFFAHVLRIAVPIIMDYAAPILGFFGPLGQIAVATLAGIQAGLPLLSGMFGYAGSDKDTEIDKNLEAILKPTGLLANVPGLIQLVGQLPGLQHHGEYFGDDIQKAYDNIAAFRR